LVNNNDEKKYEKFQKTLKLNHFFPLRQVIDFIHTFYIHMHFFIITIKVKFVEAERLYGEQN